MRRAVVLAALCAATMASGQAPERAAERPMPILTISTEQVLARSEYGRALTAEINERLSVLGAENREIEAVLEAEEQALVLRRQELGDEAFAPLADEFDRRVRRIRAEQAAKLDAIETARTSALERFREQLFPVIAEIMEARDADLVQEADRAVVSRRSIDITNDAIIAFDAAFEDAEPETILPAPPTPDTPPALDTPPEEDVPLLQP